MGYRHWILAVKRLVRAHSFFAEVRSSVDCDPRPSLLDPTLVSELRVVLERQHRRAGDTHDSLVLYGLCREIADTLGDVLGA